MVKLVPPSFLALIGFAATTFASGSKLVQATQGRSLQEATTEASVASCSAIPLTNDVLAGVDLVTDVTCSAGAVGCFGTMCHFCQRWETPASATLTLCKSLEDAKASQTCADVHVLKDSTLGLILKEDPTCADRSFGCIRSGCRICRDRDGKAMAFKSCSLIPDSSMTKTFADTKAGQDAVTEQSLSASTAMLAAGGCAVLAIGAMIFAAKRMKRDSTVPEMITPSNSIAYQRASVFHI